MATNKFKDKFSLGPELSRKLLAFIETSSTCSPDAAGSRSRGVCKARATRGHTASRSSEKTGRGALEQAWPFVSLVSNHLHGVYLLMRVRLHVHTTQINQLLCFVFRCPSLPLRNMDFTSILIYGTDVDVVYEIVSSSLQKWSIQNSLSCTKQDSPQQTSAIHKLGSFFMNQSLKVRSIIIHGDLQSGL